MRIFAKTLIAISLLANQMVISLPIPSIESAPAEAQADGSTNQNLVFNNNNSAPLQVKIEKPNFDTEVLAPLRSAQAAKAAQVKANAAKFRVAVQKTVTVAGDDVWYQLRLCESGGNYARNSGNGYYGAYQYDISTWAGYGGYARADLAPPAVQDQKAKETQAARGWSPWPACARKLGLL